MTAAVASAAADAAARMYPSAAPAEAAPQAEGYVRPTDDAAAALMYPTSAPKAAPVVETAHVDEPLADVDREVPDDLGADSDIDEDERQAAVETMRDIARTNGATVSDLQVVMSAHRSAPEHLTPEVVTGWEREAQGRLTKAYGARAGQVLADTRALVAKDARLAAYLEVSRLGSHPDVVMKLAAKSQARRKL